MGGTQENSLVLPAVPDNTGMAVAVGRIEQALLGITGTVGEIKSEVSGVVAIVNDHSVTLGIHGQRLDGHDKKFEERAPVRVPWTAVGALAVGVVGLAYSLLTP